MNKIYDKFISDMSKTKELQGVSKGINLDLKLISNNINYKFAKVYGKVTDDNGDFISDVLINIMSKDLNPLFHTYTNNAGEYYFDNIFPNKSYNIFAISKGKRLSRGKTFKTCELKSIKRDFILKEDFDMNFGIIEGKLLSFLSKKPVSNACIKLFKIINNIKTLTRITYTSINGEYIFLKVSKGEYLLEITSLNYRTTYAHGSITMPHQIVSMKLTIQAINSNVIS